MIDHALQVLYLHILWKARGLTASADPSPDEVAFRDKLQEQRDSLVEKLIEFSGYAKQMFSAVAFRPKWQSQVNLNDTHICASPVVCVITIVRP